MKLIASLGAAALVFCGSAFAQETTIEPRNTPGLPDALVPIDDMLTGGLLNDPTDLNWDHYGLGRELIQDQSYPGGGAALRIFMGPANEVYAGGINIPLLGRVRARDQITIGFFARTISSGAEDGKGRVRVRFQSNLPPYGGFGDEVVEIGTDWNFYEVTSPADRAIARDGIVALQFGLEEQVVEIGQAIVVSGTTSVLD